MRATLYVKGVRITEVEDRSYESIVVQANPSGRVAMPPRVYPDYKVVKLTTHKSVLSEDQKALIKMVRALAVKYGFKLKVIDVTKGDFLDKLETRLKGISSFPTFLTDNGHRIEGDITEERIKALFVNGAKNQ